jgi:hypothetical protein
VSEYYKEQIVGLINKFENAETLGMLFFLIKRVLEKENAAPTDQSKSCTK